jgi:hypothetical protein
LSSTRTFATANTRGVDPLLHFDQIGWREWRIPSLTVRVVSRRDRDQ